MEEGLELVDLAWREILNGFDLELLDTNTDYTLKEKQDYLHNKIKPGPYKSKSFSASRLQSFIDCPRKYYFSYVEKVDHRPEERLKIAADEMGTIEHSIIEKYFANKKIESNLIFNRKEHEEFCLFALDEFSKKNKIFLNEKTKLTTYYELLHYSQNGIEFLIKFCNENKATQVEFERQLGDNPWGLVGSIDCLIQLPENQVGLFDFKRSGAAIGSKKDTMAFDKIQIWTYLLVMIRHQKMQIHSWGYLNLSEIEASQTYSETETSVLSDTLLDEFEKLLLTSIEDVKTEVTFLANPRVPKVCDFCEVQMFCNKGSAPC